MLTEHIENALLMGTFNRLFAAEDEETVRLGFDELERLGEAYSAKASEAELEERKELGISRVESEAVLADVAAEWGMEMPKAQPDDE